MENKRIPWIDVAKGLGMILVVLGHTFYGGRTLIYIFHMPLFFFCSGLFSKNSESLKVREKLLKCIKSLLIPYFIYAAISPIIEYSISGVEWSYKDLIYKIIMGRRGDLDFNAVLWFLPTLFCVELIYYLIKKLLKNYFFIVPFVICIAFAFHCFFNNSKWLWGLDNAGYYVLYFALGDIFSRFLTEKKVMNILCGVSSIILVIVFCNVSYWTNIVATTEELHVTVRSSIDIVLAIIGILGIVGIAKGLSNNMILSNIGRYSL